MSTPDPTQDVQKVYQFWLGLIPQFFAQLGVPPAGAGAMPGAGAAPAGFAPLVDGLPFPADEIAKAATMTQQSLQSMLQAFMPALPPDGVANPFDAWTRAMAGFTSSIAATSGIAPAQVASAFDRTYGALGDALGLTPMRELSDAWRDVLAAGIAQQDARARYALIVQGAFAEGLRRVMVRLADNAQKGERIDSALALIRMWAQSTEEVLHETLQSERGLAATAALTRSALAYRKKMQKVAKVLADLLDIATRRELDDAYREIQQLKREVRALRQADREGAR